MQFLEKFDLAPSNSHRIVPKVARLHRQGVNGALDLLLDARFEIENVTSNQSSLRSSERFITVHRRVLSDSRRTSNELREGEPVDGRGEHRLGTYVFSMHGHASRFNATTLDKAHSRRLWRVSEWSLCSLKTPRAS